MRFTLLNIFVPMWLVSLTTNETMSFFRIALLQYFIYFSLFTFPNIWVVIEAFSWSSNEQAFVRNMQLWSTRLLFQLQYLSYKSPK